MLSAVIVAWNEEVRIAKCINSLKNLCDEVIVVVDEATTDSTQEVAKKHKAIVYTHPHTGIVEPMRNFALSKAKGDWILLLDADESIQPELASKIREIVGEKDIDFVKIPRKNIIFNKWIKSTHWWPDYVYRLFKKGSVVWSEDIHSIPKTAGNGLELEPQEKYAIVHDNYQSIAQFLNRLNRYTDFQSKLLLTKNITTNWSDLITKPSREFLNQFFARNGYKDGIHGLALSLLQSFSELVVYLKVWEAHGFNEQSFNENELSREFKNSYHELKWWQKDIQIKNSSGVKSFIHKAARKLDL